VPAELPPLPDVPGAPAVELVPAVPAVVPSSLQAPSEKLSADIVPTPKMNPSLFRFFI
jgi:hypothetical protein